jgi:prepilin-type N-terminal cleavage/methylation domain-containing protein
MSKSGIQKGGFTLIELLVVIAIVAILAAILFPVFASAKAAAKKTTCLSNLKQIGDAIVLYEGDYDDIFPNAIDPSDKYVQSIWNQSPTWQARIQYMPMLHEALQPYVKSKEVFHCPSDTGTNYLDSSLPNMLPSAPSLFQTYGTSYLYRTEIAFRYESQSTFSLPANINVLFDAAGNWHGSGGPISTDDLQSGDLFNVLNGYRYNTLFGDYHAKSISYAQQQAAWATPL